MELELRQVASFLEFLFVCEGGWNVAHSKIVELNLTSPSIEYSMAAIGKKFDVVS